MFKDWLVEGYSVRQLSDQSNKRSKDIISYVRNILKDFNITNIDEVFENVKHIMIDWVWISKNICLIVYYAYNLKKIIRFGFYDWEKLEYITKDLFYLRNNLFYDIISFTVDWWLQIASSIKEVYPESIIQRCLVHIHRQVISYISKNPKTEAWKELKKIVTFNNFENKESFIDKFNKWCIKWDSYLKEKSYWEKSWRYTHRRLRQARSHVKNALPYMFYYLENDEIIRDTNELESLNALIIEHVYNHRWLRKDRLISFLSYWLYSRNYK